MTQSTSQIIRVQAFRWLLLLLIAAIVAGSTVVFLAPRGSSPVLLYHGVITLYETILGFLFAVIGGFVLAVVLFALPRVAAAVWPTILFLQITPKVAIAPLLLLWFGFGALPKITIAFLISFFPILSNTFAALKSVDEDIVSLARSMRVSRYNVFRYFMVPHALPQIFSGARIAITFAIVGAVVGEFVGSDAGLGYLVILGARTLDTGLLVSSVLALAVLGIGLYGTVVFLESLLIPWDFARRRTRSRSLPVPRMGGGL